MAQPDLLRVGLTDDGVYEHVHTIDSARSILETMRGVEIARFPDTEGPVDSQLLDGFDVVLAGGFLVTDDSLAGARRCSAIVRFGAGYDRIDIDACTAAGVMLVTTPEGIRRSMATAALTHILALSTRLLQKNKLLHQGRWSEAGTQQWEGTSLSRRTLGFVGFGNIGRDLYHLVKPFGMQHLVHDPYLQKCTTKQFDIEIVDLPTLLSRADFVVILCTLTEETRQLIGAPELKLMQSSAYLINVARGAIVDQAALTQALSDGAIAGAGLDALDPEPIDAEDPLLRLETANLTPHALGYTDEMNRLCSELCAKAAQDVLCGKAPASVINLDVLNEPKLVRKLETYRRHSEELPE